MPTLASTYRSFENDDIKTKNVPYDRHYITCSKCYLRVRRSAFSLVSDDFICPDCMKQSHLTKVYQSTKGTLKLCRNCEEKQPITSYLTVNSDGCVTLQDLCHLCRERIIKANTSLCATTSLLKFAVAGVISCNVDATTNQDDFNGKIIVEAPIIISSPSYFQSSIGCFSKNYYYLLLDNPNYIKPADMNYEYIAMSFENINANDKPNKTIGSTITAYKKSIPTLASSTMPIKRISSPSSPIIESEPASPYNSDCGYKQNSLHMSPYKKANIRRNTADFRIPYSELHLVVSDEVFRGLHDDRFDELIVYSSNPQEIIQLIPDEKERKEKLLQEIVAFYKSTRDKVHCKGCKRGVIKADCFLHHTSFICRDCSMKVTPNHLTDWAIYSTVLLKCGRCKHLAPYSKFLKFNGRGEIKRQNTCAFCCLKKWREYYLGVRSY